MSFTVQIKDSWRFGMPTASRGIRFRVRVRDYVFLNFLWLEFSAQESEQIRLY